MHIFCQRGLYRGGHACLASVHSNGKAVVCGGYGWFHPGTEKKPWPHQRRTAREGARGKEK